MGCDYFVSKLLEIEYAGGKYVCRLNSVRCYFSDFSIDHTDTDDDFSEEESERKVKLKKIRKEYLNLILTPSEPKVLYENGVWSDPIYETKYKTYIDTSIQSKSFYKINSDLDNDLNNLNDLDNSDDSDDSDDSVNSDDVKDKLKNLVVSENSEKDQIKEIEEMELTNFDQIIRITKKEKRYLN